MIKTANRAVLCILSPIAVIVLALSFPAHAWELERTWKREIAEGVTFVHFRMKFERGPAHIYVVEVDPFSSYSLKPVIANNRIGSLETASSIAERSGAVAAINGGFFDTRSHLPVGLIVIKHRVLYNQWLYRAVLGIDEMGQVHFDKFKTSVELYFPAVGKSVPINGVNRPRKYGELIAYYPEYGPVTRTNEWGVEVVCRRISPLSTYYPFEVLEPERYLIQEVNRNRTPVPSDGMVLSFHLPLMRKLTWLDDVMIGEELVVRTNLPGEWDKYPYIIGGGPMLITDETIVLNPANEGFRASFASPTARTAVGRTIDGKILIVVVDAGSREYSIGATWVELAYAMKGLYELTDLMGFDGGSSSTMFVEGKVVNKPKGGAERKVSNIIAVVPYDEFL